ncbi:MAG: hypothetical protein GX379_02870 [Clostridiales bacterium]|nr:hypothetical protein [Clostridiales bacterium]
MLKIFICPKCFNYRIVSRKPDAICFHCGATLHNSEIDYIAYSDMSEEERANYKQKFIKRMKMYNEKINSELKEHEVNK